MNQIIFREKKKALSLGRNGYVWTDGLDLDKMSTMILITPINSRGHLSSCNIQIPIEHIQDLINELEKFKNG
jgi:exosome complex RNA-binding protein Rrp4